ncbi:MAG: hypothetical protein PWQ17_1907, partial [Anaerophaga sp.]|nr:hypothetical protein [Anaerophaga sp.]
MIESVLKEIFNNKCSLKSLLTPKSPTGDFFKL